MVGRKIVMSMSGLAMIFYVILHLLGNTSLFSGQESINTYAKMLHSIGPFIWTVRLVMLLALVLHIFFGIQLTLENRAAKPQKYVTTRHLSATRAGKSMVWTGLTIALYLICHLLHFTFQSLYAEFSAGSNFDAAGRPDVFMMLVQNFRHGLIAAFYIFAMAAVGLHLSHGMQSMVQTLGLNNEKTLPVMMKIGTIAAAVLFLGYISIPVSIFTGLVGRQ
jgi:succinate dehydrogenase / fumarate reductase cytochrome b subunit